MSGFALVPSPFLSASSWRGAVEALQAARRSARAIDYGGVCAPDWHVGAGLRAATACPPGAPILVLHSGAGAFAGAIVARLAEAPAALLFVDAILPRPGRSWLEGAPEGLAERLGELARDRVLPPWSRWWGEAAMTRLLPDPAARARFEADLPAVPLAFLAAPEPPFACAAPAAYLQLSPAYAAEAGEAAALGWPVRRAELGHLAMLTAPDRLAAMLVEVAAEIGA